MIHHFDAIRFEGLIDQGRTHPIILGSRQQDSNLPSLPKLIKAIGCPELYATHQLVCEVIGNTVARQMGIPTPEPCVVNISDPMAAMINRNIRNSSYDYQISSGNAAGCSYLQPPPVPFTAGQSLSPVNQHLASLTYVFDYLTGNPDRRAENMNCGLKSKKLVAFDFELCFAGLFFPLVGRSTAKPWDPEFMTADKHLFFAAMREAPLSADQIQESVQKLTVEWWHNVYADLPESWKTDGEKIGSTIRQIVDRSEEFAKDVGRSLIWT